MTQYPPSSPHQRRTIAVRGIVQGVGFRPFVYRLASELELTGWVTNTVDGVTIEVEGDRERLDDFMQRLEGQPPPQAQIDDLHAWDLPPQFDREFQVRASSAAPDEALQVTLLPDLATCEDCLREMNDPNDRRSRYPFINCTNCGPRYSILHDLPYDRPSTTMAEFDLCPYCESEYEDPSDRRFHAQPVACPQCGPQLSFEDCEASVRTSGEAALTAALWAIRAGKILAVKGIGGFYLFADARNRDAVETLRRRKARPEKPFAVMYPSLMAIAADCDCTDADRHLLASMAAPIVLLPKHQNFESLSQIAANVAPSVPDLGVMLPHSPLHHLLMQALDFPVIATSANRSGEPLCTDWSQVRSRLGGVVDAVLDHDRPIARPLDDSIVRTIRRHHGGSTSTQVLRHGCGYAPSTLDVPPGYDTDNADNKDEATQRPTVLALGAHLKNAIALSDGHKLILSQYIGDLETVAARDRLKTTIDDLLRLYRIEPEAIACDAHPDYASSQLAAQIARDRNLPLVPVQHHYAHALSGMADCGIASPTLAVTWDGTGYGLDGTAWGGEWLHVTADGWQRVAHWRTFPLPGGDVAAREPRRAALGWLFEVFGESPWAFEELRNLPTLTAFRDGERSLLNSALQRGVNAPQTSSVGRLFDAVASLLGLHQRCSYEGQGAIAVEMLARTVVDPTRCQPYPLTVVGDPTGETPAIVDSADLLRGIIADLNAGIDCAEIAARFQSTLVAAIDAIAERTGIGDILLTGGCFQNRLLAEHAIAKLEGNRSHSDARFTVHHHQRLPPNDGGLAIGQILAAWRARSS